jgi:hypothetical protein
MSQLSQLFNRVSIKVTNATNTGSSTSNDAPSPPETVTVVGARWGHASMSMGGKVYVIGGMGDHLFYDTCIFDFGKFHLITNLTTKPMMTPLQITCNGVRHTHKGGHRAHVMATLQVLWALTITTSSCLAEETVQRSTSMICTCWIHVRTHICCIFAFISSNKTHNQQSTNMTTTRKKTY